MRTRSRYIFGAALAATAGLGFLPTANHANAATVASWGFESLASNFASTGAAAGPFVADVGVGSASGLHASATSVYSSPAGNGSARSLSSNAWAVNDYYQFTTDTTGFTNIMISFDQTGSNTGPGYFTLQYSTDGSTFNNFASYTLYQGTASGFSAVENASLTHSFDLSAIAGLNGDANAVFRLVDNSVNSFAHESNGTAASVAAAGTDRVDNVVITGTSGAPEPATLGLVSIAGLGLLKRRQR